MFVDRNPREAWGVEVQWAAELRLREPDLSALIRHLVLPIGGVDSLPSLPAGGDCAQLNADAMCFEPCTIRM